MHCTSLTPSTIDRSYRKSKLTHLSGIFLGSIVGLALPHSWRLQSAAALIPAVPLLFLIFACPESPRFLIRKNQYGDAYISLRHLRDNEIQAARDLYAIHSQLQVETALLRGRDPGQWYDHEWYQQDVNSTKFIQRITSLIRIRRNRTACLSAFLVMLSQQASGVSSLLGYTNPFCSFKS